MCVRVRSCVRAYERVFARACVRVRAIACICVCAPARVWMFLFVCLSVCVVLR